VDPPELFERSEQLEILRALLKEATTGSHGHVVAIGGEAGAGKTTLVRHFCAEAQPNALVLAGACSPLHAARPLGPFLELADESPVVAAAVAAGGRADEVASALLGEVRPGRSLVVVLEDMHWADEATLDVVRLLARRVESRPAVVIATYRDDELNRAHPFRILLGDLPASLARIRVPLFSAAGVAELAAPAGIDGGELYRRTGGNPFFVTEVLSAPGEAIPETVRDAVLARASRLDPEEHAILEVVAATPPHTELALLEALAPSALARVDACVGAGILVSERDTVSFRHELARIAIDDSLSPGRRVELHRAALKALAASGDLARLSYHAEAASDADAVLEYAPRAAREAAALGAHREAEVHYARALRHASRMEPDVRAEILEAHSHECYITDRGAEAIESGRDAAAIFRELRDPLREAASLLKLSRIQRMTGKIAEASESVGRALALLGGLPEGPELAKAYAATAQITMGSADTEQMHAAATRALELAGELGESEVLADVLITLGTIEIEVPATREAGREKLARAIRLAKDERLDPLVGRAYNTLSYEGFATLDLELVEACVADYIAYCTDYALELWLHCALGFRAELELVRGDWDAAVETATRVLRSTDTTIPRMGPLAVLALIRARRGDPDAHGPLDEALALARPAAEPQVILPVIQARAEVAWLEGRLPAMAEELDANIELARRLNDHWAFRELVYWRWKAGDAGPSPDADLALRRLQLEGASEQAAEGWAALGYPYEAAVARSESDDDSSISRAHDELRALGAQAAAAIVARRLRERGVRGVRRGPRASTAENPGQLTRREVDVVKLVVQGLRDAEIAARLHLSEKTVGHHVSSILRKLDVRSRGQAAAEAIRLGLADGAAS
jgi:DNA-binding CsgD family transcriptional regulator/tetratricopeptide (TPR) repeat protein